ncbi:MAG: ABC transporter ATP-binding protein [Rhodospirillaceae bacterium]|nr:ABC transporter ATP-binding protein [Rhodospirillaceae bacterium]
MPPKHQVALRGIEHRYPSGTLALSGIDLDVAAGAFVCLVGPSGCGKSTLLRIMSGLVAPSTGTVEVATGRGEIGFVFQEPTLMPWSNVAANVALPLDLTGAPRQQSGPRVDEALRGVGLGAFGQAYPHELSGGMRMRASIARAMVTAPRLLLMDEPFAALDEFTRFKLNDDLLALWQANRWTVVFVTHSIREAVFLGQRLIVMTPGPGRIAADLDVRLPAARDAALRLSHAFADECARVTAAFGQGLAA